MLKTLFAVATVAVAALLAGCPAMPPAEAARSFYEEVAYQDGRAQAVEKTVDQLACYKGYDANGLCVEAGKPISPAVALGLLTKLKTVRAGFRTAVTLPDGGGACLGKDQSPPACLQAATQLLLDVELELRKLQGG
jgi:hypothetical protein